MKILFLYKNFEPERHWNCLKAQEKNMGAIPPLNLCYVAAVARQQGHDVSLIDLQVEKYSFAQLIGKIDELSPDLLAFTLTTYLFHSTRKWIAELKKATSLPVLVGGYHLSLYYKETAKYDEFDYCYTESYGKSLHSFFKNLNLSIYADKSFDLDNEDDKNYCTQLNDIAFPARDLLKNKFYGNYISKRKNFTVMITGIGCPYSCKYCTSSSQMATLRSVDSVVDEIEECYIKYGIREIDFYDQSFTVNKQRTISICEEIIKRKINIVWSIRTRADLLDPELIEIMKKAGLYRVMLGIESGSQKILDRLNKKETILEIENIVLLLNKIKIKVLGFFMLGCPDETASTLEETKKFALRLPFDDIQVTRFTLFPATPFYEEYLAIPSNNDYWRDYISGKCDALYPSLLDTDFNTQFIDKKVKNLYLVFYLRPRVMWRKIMNGKLINNILKYSKALFDMVRN